MKKNILGILALSLLATFAVSLTACGGSKSNVIPKEKARDVGDWVLPIVDNPGDFDLIDEVDIQALLKRDDVKVVLIDFWATWCEPCKAAMPYLNEIYLENKDKGLAAVVITIDINNPTFKRKIKEDVAHLGVNYPIPWDYDSQVKAFYGIGPIPVTYLVDKDGKIRYEHSGFTKEEIDMPPLREALEILLNE